MQFSLLDSIDYMNMRNRYEKPSMKVMMLESENGFLTGSVTTIVKPFNITAAPYEEADDSWYSAKLSNTTFD